ncbi:MAG TPA: hypothetical protein DCR14_05785 [Acidimicrobiaceae bacterium]|nr:hypothetical protein [Acidimicrobiaceae bacterium]
MASLLTGCQLGERPYFSDDPYAAGTPTGDPVVDAVLAKLDAASTGPLTAGYAGLVKFGSTEFSASVLLDGDRRLVTLSNAIYRDTPEGQQTCAADGSRPCEQGLLAARASDTQLTVDFYAADAATRLRRKAAAKVGPATERTATFAGQAATCADLPISDGATTFTVSYCVLDNGVIALIDDSDVRIELALYLNSVDATQFTLQ